jgi:hypothetical protein
MIARTRIRLARLALALAVVVGAYSWGGIAMAGSFAAAAPERASNYRLAAAVYLCILIASVIGAIVAVTILWRARRSSE